MDEHSKELLKILVCLEGKKVNISKHTLGTLHFFFSSGRPRFYVSERYSFSADEVKEIVFGRGTYPTIYFRN